jgi:putative addiction module component (TIGR02574 family)
LPEQERARVVQDLLNSLSPESGELLDDAWEEELDRRLAAGRILRLSVFESRGIGMVEKP